MEGRVSQQPGLYERERFLAWLRLVLEGGMLSLSYEASRQLARDFGIHRIPPASSTKHTSYPELELATLKRTGNGNTPYLSIETRASKKLYHYLTLPFGLCTFPTIGQKDKWLHQLIYEAHPHATIITRCNS